MPKLIFCFSFISLNAKAGVCNKSYSLWHQKGRQDGHVTGTCMELYPLAPRLVTILFASVWSDLLIPSALAITQKPPSSPLTFSCLILFMSCTSAGHFLQESLFQGLEPAPSLCSSVPFPTTLPTHLELP